MADVTCSRCGTVAPGLDHPPLPGENGNLVRSRVCAACWREWLGMQVKFINEYRLSPTDAQHYEFLVAQMKIFLNLQGE